MTDHPAVQKPKARIAFEAWLARQNNAPLYWNQSDAMLSAFVAGHAEATSAMQAISEPHPPTAVPQSAEHSGIAADGPLPSAHTGHLVGTAAVPVLTASSPGTGMPLAVEVCVHRQGNRDLVSGLFPMGTPLLPGTHTLYAGGRTPVETPVASIQVPTGDSWREGAAGRRPAPAADDAQTAAARDVLAERHRQISVEGWTPEHDDAHTDGALAQAAACYAASSQSRDISYMAHLWPWSTAWWKPGTSRGDLLKAGALILAEIERQDRARAAFEAQRKGDA
ncbi:hypothetical protein [Achromobacter sp. DH1f]|uniref:hypothetical protein n=1 Tax=Achromobacter sp. DH1f TaxID=1397275 RepID=UPI00046811E8|nr:hypothetical protein [Achromobacter sp. DH1f]